MPVRVEHNGHVTTVIHARPEARNAVDRAHAEALAAAFAEFERDEQARVAVLFGEGGNFCAGADLKAVATARANRLLPPPGSGAVDASGPMGPTRMQLSKPVIAAVAGYAVAGGLELALWCDLRVVERGATFGVFCRRWGVPLVDGGTIRLPRLIGQGRALDMILTGRPVGAEEALRIGLADRVVEGGAARAAAEQLAAEIAAFPQRCVRADRQSALEQWSLPEPAALANEFRHGSAVIESGETQQRRGALRRGRRPARELRVSKPSRKRWLAALDWCSLTAAFALTALAFARIETLPPLAWAPLLLLAAALGWAFADFASGLVHFLCDRFGSEATPLLGPAVIRPFREHHVDPSAITAHGFVELSGNNALALTPMLAAGTQLAPLFGEALLASALFSWLMSASVGLFTTNQLHRWAHMARAPRLARALQRLGLAISATGHARHHSEAHDRSFCITTGWCNGPLDRVNAWAHLERRLRDAGLPAGSVESKRAPLPSAEHA